MSTIAMLVEDVRRAFRFGIPNGLKLNWNADRFFPQIKRICEKCHVVNGTDFNYSYCNSFDVEPTEMEGGNRYVLNVKFSFIAPAYSIHTTKYSRDKKLGRVVQESERPAILSLAHSVRDFAKQAGFQEVDGRSHDIVVDGVQLELSEVATLGKCLFDDFE